MKRVPASGEVAHDVEHFRGEFRVQGARGLVQQQQARAGGERTGDGDALLLAAGQLGWPLGQRSLPDRGARAARGRDRRPRRQLAPCTIAQGQRHVLQSGQVVEQAAVLEDEAQGRAVGAQSTPRRRSTGLPSTAMVPAVGAIQAADDAQQRGLPAARGADDGERRYLLVEGDVAQHFHAVEGLAQMIEANEHGVPPGL